MTKPIPQPDQDEPLDPAVEAIRVKLVRLLMVSGGIMMLGFMAVLLAIVYKWNRKPTTPTPVIGELASGTVAIPKGATIISTAANGNGLILTIKLASGTLLIQRYDAAGKITSKFSVIEE
jgi:YD repeat-containing protein